ncbi:serine/threonine-protein kinase ICK [Protopterus annectens]|uniref:serine/threonine-protein kinase ICK n=1 Tax=Protopterus annectens TaxID=7888 RepID=UPI001CF974B9|nr:serine/threonine-protein kinase ICK [Protopterus annectens]
MNRYNVIKQLGDGTYGSVHLGRSLDSGELVAIKRMKRKFYSWEECMSLREVKSLKKLNHANVVRLKEVIRENNHLYFVLEYMKENLYQLMKERNKLFPESAIRNIMFQILQGLAFIHKHGFFHRDLKPENLLCMGPELVKIADFGLAREIRSRPPYTDYVSTRWYRAPEVLLRSTSYSSPIDLWAVGCIMAEIYTLRPLFPGSSEVDTIFKICQVLGTPKKNDWIEGYSLAASMNFRWPQCVPSNLKTLIPNASNEAIQVMRDLLQWDPRKRPSASQALRYSYFHVGQALGTPHQILDKGRPHKGKQEQQSSVDIRPVPPPQPQNLSHPATRPLMPIQQLQHASHPPKSNPHQDGMVSTVEEKKISRQPLLPAIKNKAAKQKAAVGTENSVSVGDVKPKGARKRWDLIKRDSKGSDEWDDAEDLDLGSSLNKSSLHLNRRRQNEEMPCRLESILDLKPSSNKGIHHTVPACISFQSRESAASRATSAKQHYLKQSRYLPGITTKNNATGNSAKDFNLSGLWTSTSIPVKSSGIKGEGNLINQSKAGPGGVASTAATGYVPSFLNKEIGSGGQRRQLVPRLELQSKCASWKSNRAPWEQPVFNSSKSTPGLTPLPPTAHTALGRKYWSSKYGGHQ